MRYFVFSIFFFLISILNLLTQINEKYSGLTVGDTVTVIDKKINYKARFYFFINLSHCSFCFYNINQLAKRYENDNEFVLFIYNADEKEIKYLRHNFNKNIKIIGDTYGIYNEYYKVNYKPLVYILNNAGVVKSWMSVKNLKFREIDSLMNLLKVGRTNIFYNKDIKEIERLKIYQKGVPVLTSFFRKCMYRGSDSSFVFENMRLPEIYFIDSAGEVTKSINVLDYPQYNIIQFFDFSWAVDDSVLFLYGNDNKDVIFQYYNIHTDTISKVFRLSSLNKESRCIESINATYLTGLKKFVNSIWFVGQTENRYMNKGDTCAKLWSSEGELLKTFDVPDSIYLKFKLSDSFGNVFSFSNGKVYSIQEFSSIIKVWDENLNLIKTFKIDLGRKYRYIRNDLASIEKDEDVMIFWNSISKYLVLLIDKTNGNILVSYKNVTYPPGVYDYMSDKVKHEVIINIYNSEGEKLNKQEIILPKATLPFHFEDNYIYTTETNGNKLEIVKYKFIKTE